MKKHSKITAILMISFILVLAFPITAAAAPSTTTIPINIESVMPTQPTVNQTVVINVTSTYNKPITWSVTAPVGTTASFPPIPTSYPHSTTLTVKSTTVGAQTIKLTATDSSNKRIKATKEIVITFTSVSSGLVYVALGDSIPYGYYNTSLLNYLAGGTNSYSYIEQFRDKLGILPANYYDKSVSGYNTIDVVNQFDDPVADAGIRALIAKADVITLCVGANDIMDAAARGAGGLSKYSISWTTANQGRNAFEAYWIDIVDGIETLNPDVTLIVMTIYNPYRTTEGIYGQVNSYFEETQDTEVTNFGLNYIIRNTETLYDNTPQPIDETLDYRVADVYNAFNTSTNKDSLTGFYRSFCDPHPNQLGQDLIFKTHYEAFTAL